MYQQIVVPMDGSDHSLRAFGPAKQVAARSDSPVVIIMVIGPDENAAELEARLRTRLRGFDPAVDRINLQVAPSPANAIIAELERVPGSLLCLCSAGHLRSEPILGLVTEQVLRATTSPAMLIGPHVDADAWTLHGPLLLCTDGSLTASTMIPIAAQWGIAMGVELAVCVVGDSRIDDEGAAAELAGRVAHELREAIGRPVSFDALHGTDAAKLIIRYADDQAVGLIAAATHGRTGLSRIAMGSTTMSLVRHAHVPVLTQRPPKFAQES